MRSYALVSLLGLVLGAVSATPIDTSASTEHAVIETTPTENLAGKYSYGGYPGYHYGHRYYKRDEDAADTEEADEDHDLYRGRGRHGGGHRYKRDDIKINDIDSDSDEDHDLYRGRERHGGGRRNKRSDITVNDVDADIGRDLYHDGWGYYGGHRGEYY